MSKTEKAIVAAEQALARWVAALERVELARAKYEALVARRTGALQ